MPARKLAVEGVADGQALHAGLEALRSRLQIPEEFPPEVTAAADRAAAEPRLPGLDRTDLELVTIDPPGARDLDQALHVARAGDGYVVSYAIADVAAFVTGSDPVDVEAKRRGLTYYAPDTKIPLHPPVLSEGAASLLPGETRPALLWTLAVDQRGSLGEVSVQRALVRSREQLDYPGVQAELDGGSPRELLRLLAEVGRLREQQERERGGVSLQIPDQEVYATADGWALRYRANLPVEGWNAQISLLTGIAAARLMLAAKVGVVRALPPAAKRDVRRLRSVAKALRVPWPASQPYPDFVRGLDPARPAEAAMLTACATLFRGAGYAALQGEVPAQSEHAALATPYAHVTAPLRRLVDRYAGEVCLALCAGEPVPDWVLSELDELPALMRAAEQQVKRYERAVIDLVEAYLLRDRVGETMLGTVTEVAERGDRGEVMIADPAVTGRIRGADLPLGEEIEVRLVEVDTEQGAVEFTRA